MYLLRLYNDTHNEFNVFEVPVLPNEKQTVLSLAGDIYDRKHLMEWLRPLAARFKAVVVVLGNHDYWKGDVDRLQVTIKQWQRDNPIPNLHVLFDEAVEIDGTVFFGGTMWTDLNKKDPLTMISDKPFNDFRMIRYENYIKRWSPKEQYRRHYVYRQKLWNTLALPEHQGKRFVVLSHHAPHQLSSDPRRTDRIENGFYTSDLSELILDHPQIVLWHHGHTHYKNWYYIGDTPVACNPRGYIPEGPVKDFDPEMIIDLDAMPVP
jgi:predicted MPP superfamily phosphohydrolase